MTRYNIMNIYDHHNELKKISGKIINIEKVTKSIKSKLCFREFTESCHLNNFV